MLLRNRITARILFVVPGNRAQKVRFCAQPFMMLLMIR